MRDLVVELPGRRRLAVREEGDPEGLPVFSLHGTPGSRLLYSKHVADAQRRGIRLIGYDRPGYGGSTTVRGRRIDDASSDVAAIADHLKIDRFGVWGHSGGGMLALACAAHLPDRAVAVASLAGVAPPGAEGLDRLAGMGEANAEDYRLMESDRAAWEAKVVRDSAQMAHANLEELLEMFRSLVSDVDMRAVSLELGEFLIAQSREGLRHGGDGVRDDNLSELAPWGFELSSIRVPLQIWHGRHDRFVPFSHGQWLAAHVPRAEPHLEENEGHLSLYERRIPEVQGWIASKF
jgi:pimeloyl-ACP methyl ester carboxylesterase